MCLLIDGLDEIGADHTHDILRIIDGLSAFPYLKCIVSSRPEEAFSRHFTRRAARTLRMQDFTESDIRRYATEELSEWVDNSERLRDVVKTLCEKAGVFLWVALAIKGQRLGVVYKDDPELLAGRLEKLPVGLSELYCDMWHRLNEDKDIYGEQGARYLNLLAMEWPPFSLMTLLTMAFATQPALNQKSFQPSNLSFLGELEDIMEDHAVWIRVRTAGLIDTETDRLPQEIEFVHRSAVEFLENTAEGRAIAGLDKTSPDERAVSLLIAELAIIKWECDVERLGRFITHKHSRGYSAPPFDLCGRVKSLERLLEDARDLYEGGVIEETIFILRHSITPRQHMRQSGSSATNTRFVNAIAFQPTFQAISSGLWLVWGHLSMSQRRSRNSRLREGCARATSNISGQRHAMASSKHVQNPIPR